MICIPGLIQDKIPPPIVSAFMSGKIEKAGQVTRFLRWYRQGRRVTDVISNTPALCRVLHRPLPRLRTDFWQQGNAGALRPD
jgi:hypothetical protein